jgi:threonine dehydrogenase-like Zn-dependent dehydrogenase
MSTTMRRVIVDVDDIALHAAPVPKPGPGEVLVRTLLAGVCGSDTHASRGRHPFIQLPYVPGHEVLGVVLEFGAPGTSDAGPSGPTLRRGQRVVIEPDLPCWHCKMCTTARENLCENLRFFGCGTAQGGMADYFTIPANRLHAVPDELDDYAAALIEPLSTPVHAVGLAGSVTDKAVVVFGAGTIGLLVLKVALAYGARRVVVTDVLASKRDLAVRFGAHAAIDAQAGDVAAQVRTELGESADVVFDCVSSEPTLVQAVAAASKGGTVVAVGVPTADARLPMPVVQDHQIRIQGSATYLPHDYDESIRLLRERAVRAEDFVTAAYPLAEAATAFTESASGTHLKVLVNVAGTTVGHTASAAKQCHR